MMFYNIFGWWCAIAISLTVQKRVKNTSGEDGSARHNSTKRPRPTFLSPLSRMASMSSSVISLSLEAKTCVAPWRMMDSISSLPSLLAVGSTSLPVGCEQECFAQNRVLMLPPLFAAMSNCGDDAVPCWMTMESSRSFISALSTILSSTVFSVMKRKTRTCFCWPILWARS